MEQEQQLLELRPIPGINLKLLAVTIVTVASSTASFVGAYFSITNHFDTVVLTEAHKRELLQLEFQEYKIRLNALEVNVEAMRRRVYSEPGPLPEQTDHP